MIHFTSTLRASALNGKVKEVDLDPNIIGVEARAQLHRIVVEGFNTALKMVGNNKAYEVNAACSIFVEGNYVHAFASCKNHTNTTILNKFLDDFIDHIATILQSLNLTTLTEFNVFYVY